MVNYDKGDNSMQGWQAIQLAAVEEDNGMYYFNKEILINCIAQMTHEELSRFCREYLLYMEFYSFHRNTWVAEDTEFINQHPDKLNKVVQINFDQPITFFRRE